MKELRTIIFYGLLLLVVIPLPALARMTPVEDSELAKIKASSGVSICINSVSFDLSIGGIKYTDTDTGNAIEFNNITGHDGAGGPMTFDTGDAPIILDLLTVDDVSSPINGETLFSLVNSDWTQAVYYTVDNLVFCNQDLGSLDIGLIDIPNSYLYLDPHGGVGFEVGLELKVDDFSYTYNTAPTSLSLQGIHLSESASGAPESPGTWAFSGKFRVGNLFDNDPARLDVITKTVNNTTHVILDLPMTGTLRIEDLDFGGEDFGPCAIDGITVHRLSVEIPSI